MKSRIHISFILLLTIFCFTCKQKDNSTGILLQAEKLLEVAPESALQLLESQSENIQKETEDLRMRHILLLTKAKEVCGIPHTSDSLIWKVVKYYETYGTNLQAAEAYYYQGCVYRDRNDVDYALEAFQLAAYLPPSSEHHLLGNAYNQMGNLFLFQKLNFEAMEAYRKAAQHAWQEKDSTEWAERLKHTAHAYTALNKPDSALHYYKLALQANPDLQQKGIERGKANLYIKMKDFQKAKQALEHDMEAYLTWADYYHGINKRDSASQYYTYALNRTNTNDLQRKVIYQRLAAYAEEKREIQKAYMYLKLADQIQDTIQNKYETEVVRQAQLIHAYRNASKKKYKTFQKEKEEEPTETLPILSVLIISFLGIGTGIVLYLKRKKQVDYHLPEVNNLYKSAIYQLIKNQAHNPDFKLTDEQWQELQVEIDNTYNHFTARLYAICPKLNETELHVCYLLKLSIAPSDIAHIIVRQVSTVSSIRERLYKKIHGEPGNAKQLDDFILKF